MNTRALWIRRCCHVLLAIQAVCFCWIFFFGFVKALLDDTPSDCGLTGKGLIPFFVIGMLMIGALMLLTITLLRRSERRYAWVGLLALAIIAAMPFIR